MSKPSANFRRKVATMGVHTRNHSAQPPDASAAKLTWKIAAALLHTVPLGLFAGPVVVSFTDWPLGYRVAVGGMIGVVVGAAVGTADWLGLSDLLRRRRQAPVAEPGAPGKPAATLESKPTDELWAPVIFPPVFAGLILCIPIMGTSRGGPWGNIFILFLVGAAFVICGAVVNPPRLLELARRGKWAPPGTTTHPYHVGVALTALIMAAVVAILHAGVWVLELCGV